MVLYLRALVQRAGCVDELGTLFGLITSKEVRNNSVTMIIVENENYKIILLVALHRLSLCYVTLLVPVWLCKIDTTTGIDQLINYF